MTMPKVASSCTSVIATARNLIQTTTLIVIYDIEVQLQTDTCRCVCFWLCDMNYKILSKHHATSLPSFVEYLKKIDNDLILIAHNGHNYDHLFVLDYLEARLSTPQIGLTRYKNGQYIWQFRDSYKYFTSSLAVIGRDIVNLEKIEIDLGTENDEEMIRYCHRDCEIVHRLLLWLNVNMIKHYNLPHHLMCYYSQADMAYDIVSRQLTQFVYTFIDGISDVLSASYYGGRVYSPIYGAEHREELCCIDIRSMYPASLCREYPCGETSFVTQFVPNRLGIYYIEASRSQVDCVKATKAILPIHLENSLAFVSSGEICGWYCQPDIEAMIKDNWSVNIRHGFVWAETTIELRSVYQSLYERRKQTPKGHALNHTLKIVLNSSYGKFCQKHGRLNSRPHYVGWFCLAYTRLQLYELMQLTGDQPVWYGDTDSIYVNKDVVSRLTPAMLTNQLSITNDAITVDVESYHSCIGVVARKVYYTDNVVKCKGVRNATRAMLRESMSYPVKCKYLAKKSRVLKGHDGVYRVDSHNLYDAKRTLRVVVPTYMYKCSCGLFHSKTIKLY